MSDGLEERLSSMLDDGRGLWLLDAVCQLYAELGPSRQPAVLTMHAGADDEGTVGVFVVTPAAEGTVLRGRLTIGADGQPGEVVMLGDGGR